MVVSLRAPLVAVLVIHLAGAPVIAQTIVQAADAPNWQKLGERLTSGIRLEITTMAGETVTGHLLSVSDSAFTLQMPDRTELPYPQSKVRDRRIGFGDIQSMTYYGGLKSVNGPRIARIAVGVLIGVGIAAVTSFFVILGKDKA